MKKRFKRKIRKNRKIAQRFFRKIKDVCAIFFVGFCILLLTYQVVFGTKIAESKMEKETYMVIESAIGEEHIPIQQYLVGLLAGSIDLSYDDEVLKAQSILLRSSILRKRKNAEDTTEKYLLPEEENAQKYMSIYDMQQLYGKEFDEIYERLRGIVESTKGMYLSYDGQPILGAFCALSSGNTRSGKDIFQKEEYEYLESISCEYDVTSENYSENHYFTWKEIYGKLGNTEIESQTDDEGKEKTQKIEIIRTDASGYVTQIQVGDRKMPGEEFRTMLHLNSAHMEIKELEAGVQIQTKGIGHGFGMSQYMAQSLAEKNYDYMEILSFFYPHAEIEKE